MFFPQSYALAVSLCFMTMICWGSWANTQKLATKEWPFQLFYWDYTFGIVILALVSGLTLGSSGELGRGFFEDLSQGNIQSLLLALTGGVVFNIANLLLVAAIDFAGMAVAFPVGIGLALVLGVLVNYAANPVGDAIPLMAGVALVTLAIIFDAKAYQRVQTNDSASVKKGLVIALAAGFLMSFFFYLVAASLVTDFSDPESGKLSPYSGVFIFSLGILISNFLWNTIFMYRPLKGPKVAYSEYFTKGNLGTHLIGLLGGAIWCLGMSLAILASDQAGEAISYGLGQGATMIAAIWGVFIWKEFKGAPPGTNRLIGLMFLCFLSGLILIIVARLG